MSRTFDESKVKRDGQGQFAEKAGGGSWLRAAADQLDPQRRALAPRAGELPRGATSLAGLAGAFADKEPTAAELEQAKAYLNRAGGFDDPGTGMHVWLPETPEWADRVWGIAYTDGKLIGTWHIRSEDGRRVVGTAERHYLPDGSVQHELFELTDRKARGGGLAARWNHRVEAMYRANGVDKITLTANMDVGGYAWAKQGYSFADISEMQELVGKIQKFHRERPDLFAFPDDVKDLAARATQAHWDAGTAPTPLELAMIGWAEGLDAGHETAWPGKDFMRHQKWEAVKHL